MDVRAVRFFFKESLVMLSYKVYNPRSVESEKMLPVDVIGDKPLG
jgi:hypothetical protein